MGITSTVSDKEGKKECLDLNKLENKTDTNNKSKKIRQRHKKISTSLQKKNLMSPVQRLLGICQEVFADGRTNVVPPPEDIQRLRAFLDDLRPEDFDVAPYMPYIRRMMADRPQAIAYLHLHECDKFSIGIFFLPPSGVIPLHNHPGMTVFSKLLFGTMHIKSYDWVVDEQSEASAIPTQTKPFGPRLAKVKINSEFTAPCNTSILYPADGGNMHRFTGVTACAVLDVLGPPYSDAEGRHCTYYRDFPFESLSVDGVSVAEEEKGGHAWLEEMEKPEDHSVVGVLYSGPTVTKK